MGRRDRVAAVLLAGWLGALLAYRQAYVEPREWGAICAAASSPLACLPRAGLLWMQQHGLWGGFALILGLAASAGAPVAAWAMAAGIAGVVNYNATFGLLGAAIGFCAWVSPAAAATRQATPAPAPPPSTPAPGG
jgi:hypothetical protein